jgi:transposase
VVEPTGIYSRAVVQQGQDAGRDVRLAPPRQAQRFLQAQPRRAKTDRIDSEGLARFGHSAILRPFARKSALVETVDQLLAARKGISTALCRLRQQRQGLPLATEVLDATIADLRTRQVEVDRQIAATVAASELADSIATLQTIPGIGPVIATAVASCLETHHFTHPDQFVAYIGLDVTVHDSGQRTGGGNLSHQGSAELRRLLYLAAQANQRIQDPDNPFRQQYQRERAKGLPTTAALCAVARKLARTCWSIHKHATTYDPSRVTRQPARPPVEPAAGLDTEP